MLEMVMLLCSEMWKVESNSPRRQTTFPEFVSPRLFRCPSPGRERNTNYVLVRDFGSEAANCWDAQSRNHADANSLRGKRGTDQDCDEVPRITDKFRDLAGLLSAHREPPGYEACRSADHAANLLPESDLLSEHGISSLLRNGLESSTVHRLSGFRTASHENPCKLNLQERRVGAIRV